MLIATCFAHLDLAFMPSLAAQGRRSEDLLALCRGKLPGMKRISQYAQSRLCKAGHKATHRNAFAKRTSWWLEKRGDPDPTAQTEDHQTVKVAEHSLLQEMLFTQLTNLQRRQCRQYRVPGTCAIQPQHLK